MISSIYHTLFYDPLYNGLVFLLSVLPEWVDVGMAIIIFTVIVKLILFPLSKASIKNQIQMKELEPKVAEIKKRVKNTQEQSMEILKLYKEYKLNPFSGIFLVLIQIPIIIALYRVFLVGGLPTIHTEILYPFIQAPLHAVDMHLFSIDISAKSMLLAFLAAVSQFFQVKYSIPEIKIDKTQPPSFKNDLARSMNVQMKYILPIIVFFIAYSVNAAIAIYWVTSNVFAIAQELFVRRKLVNASNNKLKEALIVK